MESEGGVSVVRGCTWIKVAEDEGGDVGGKPGKEVLAVVGAAAVEDGLHVDREEVKLGTLALLLGKEGGREGGREGGEGGREEGREGGREGGRKGGREGRGEVGGSFIPCTSQRGQFLS